MKLKNLFYLLLALPLAFAACEEDKPVEVKEPVLTLTSSDVIEVDAIAHTEAISYKLENPVEGLQLTATADVDWINNFTFNEEIYFSIEANDTFDAREGKVTVAYDKQSFAVTVKQAGKNREAEIVIVSGDGVEFEAEGGNGVIEFELKNGDETTNFSITSDMANWVDDIEVLEDESKITYTVAANTKAQSRSGSFEIVYGECVKEVHISQKPFIEEGKPALSLKSDATVKFAAEGGNGVIKYELINPAEGVEVEATADEAWVSGLTVDAAKSEVAFAVAANETEEARVAYIIVAYGDLNFEVAVNQEGAEPKEEPVADPELTLKGEATKEFTAEGGNGEFVFELKNAVEGTELKATCEAAWVSGVAVDAANSKVTYVVAANDTTEARETKVVLAYGELKVEVTVKQAAGESNEPTFKLKSLSSVNAPAAGADSVIGYTLENPVEGVAVEATADVEWITINEIDTEKKRIYYRVQETDSREERIGVVTATYGEYGSFTVTVTQKGGSPVLSVFANASMEYEYVATRVQLNYQVKFPNEGVEVVTTFEYLSPEGVADWAGEAVNTVNVDEEGNSDLVINGNVAFDLAENTERGDRTLRVTLTYGDQTFSQEITQKDNFPDDVDMTIAEVHAKVSNEGKDWTLLFIENDPVLGPAMTNIVFGLKEGNIQYIPNGTYGPYSTRKGGIREGAVNNFDTSDISGSVYRHNVSSAAFAITDEDREMTIEINEAKQTAKITGHFIAAQYNTEEEKWNAVRVKINWNGPVNGFMYTDPEEPVYEWESFGISYSAKTPAWAPNHTLCKVEGLSTLGVKVIFDLLAYPAGEAYNLVAGTYTVMDFMTVNTTTTENACDTGNRGVYASKINDYGLVSGSVVVEDVAEGKKLSYDVIDINGTHLTGTYVGPIE